MLTGWIVFNDPVWLVEKIRLFLLRRCLLLFKWQKKPGKLYSEHRRVSVHRRWGEDGSSPLLPRPSLPEAGVTLTFFFFFPGSRRPRLEQQPDERRGRLVVSARPPTRVLPGCVPGQPLRVRYRARGAGHRGLRMRVPVRGHQSAAQRRRVHMPGRLQAGRRRQILLMWVGYNVAEGYEVVTGTATGEVAVDRKKRVQRTRGGETGGRDETSGVEVVGEDTRWCGRPPSLFEFDTDFFNFFYVSIVNRKIRHKRNETIFETS